MPFLPQSKREKIILFYLILFLMYLAVEIFMGARYAPYRDSDFRAFEWNSHTLWQLKSNYTGKAFGQDIQTNRAGFRGTREYSVKPNHALRIVTIGDSRTYGYGVGTDETFSAVCERELRKRNLDAEVINAGTHGFSSVQCRARLEEMLKYKPDIAVLAPGYNDRRYLITRGPDSDESFSYIANLRWTMDWIETSNVMFGLIYEIAKYKLQEIKEHPPGLDEVEVRAPKDIFIAELNKSIAICRENGIQPIFMLIYQDPGTYGFAENMLKLHEEGKTQEAIDAIENAFNTIPNFSYNLSRYYLGQFYEAVGNKEKAREAYASHKPFPSIFGQSVLRSERHYYEWMTKVAEDNDVPNVDGMEAIVGSLPEEEATDFVLQFYLDECHFMPAGHERMGAALAQTVLSLQSNEGILEPE